MKSQVHYERTSSFTPVRADTASITAWLLVRSDSTTSARARRVRRTCPACPAPLPNLAILDQGGACGAASPASAPGSASGRPARRTPGHTSRHPDHRAHTSVSSASDCPARGHCTNGSCPGPPPAIGLRRPSMGIRPGLLDRFAVSLSQACVVPPRSGAPAVGVLCRELAPERRLHLLGYSCDGFEHRPD